MLFSLRAREYHADLEHRIMKPGEILCPPMSVRPKFIQLETDLQERSIITAVLDSHFNLLLVVTSCVVGPTYTGLVNQPLFYLLLELPNFKLQTSTATSCSPQHHLEVWQCFRDQTRLKGMAFGNHCRS